MSTSPPTVDVPDGSVARRAAALLPDSSVVAAFHHLSVSCSRTSPVTSRVT